MFQQMRERAEPCCILTFQPKALCVDTLRRRQDGLKLCPCVCAYNAFAHGPEARANQFVVRPVEWQDACGEVCPDRYTSRVEPSDALWLRNRFLAFSQSSEEDVPFVQLSLPPVEISRGEFAKAGFRQA
jgi:hypothetical protein